MDSQKTEIEEKEKILLYLLKKDETKIATDSSITPNPIINTINITNNIDNIKAMHTTKIVDNTNSFDKVCRTCLSQKEELISLFTDHYNDMLMYITTLQFVLNDGMPPNICSQCITNLKNAFTFKRQIDHADSYLRQYISKHPHDILPTNMLELNYDENEHEQTQNNYVALNENDSFKCNSNQLINIPVSVNDKNTQSSLLYQHDSNVSSIPAQSGFNAPSQPLFLLLRENANNNTAEIKNNINEKVAKTEIKLNENTVTPSTSKTSIPNTSSSIKKIDEQSYIEDVSGFGEHFLVKNTEKLNQETKDVKSTKPRRKRRKKVKEMKYKDGSDSDADDTNKKIKKKRKCIITSSDENDCCDNASNEDDYKPKKKSKPKTGENSKKVTINHKCHICNKVFPLKSGLRTHMRTHGIGEKNHICTYCNKSFYAPFELVIHTRTHTGEKPYVCETCKKCFSDPRSLLKHKKIHTGEKKYECDICKKRFIHAFTLRVHKRIHTGEKPFICSTCGHGCNTSTQLTLHMRIHTQEKPYSCKQCPKKFASSSGLSTHQLTHTGQRRYMCSYCGKGARTSTDLQTHIRTHTGEKPYACKLVPCTKRYKTQSHLSAHMRTHTGEKNHKCRYCEKAFADTTQLKCHENIHTGVRPYVCKICGNRFTQSGSLYTHMKSHDTTALQLQT